MPTCTKNENVKKSCSGEQYFSPTHNRVKTLFWIDPSQVGMVVCYA
jgi:hypothetical protein